MLYEIYCQEFHQKRIMFNEGLNVVLGTNTGDNSIGKSTFLMIVDFVFGGNTYSKAPDIQKNVPPHDIYFSFKRDTEYFYFCRNNIESRTVWKCDKNYSKLSEISISEYREWLDVYYNLQLPALSFRDAVGRYMRIYGKENLNERHPLNYTSKENDKKASYALLKMFDCYSPIAELETQAQKDEEKLKTFQKAQKLAYVEKIDKTTYNKNIKELEILYNELNKLYSKLDNGLLDVDSIVSEKALELKKELSNVRRMRGILNNRLNTIDDNYNYKFSFDTNSIAELTRFFPNVDLRALEEIESFHKQISTIFKNELKQERQKLMQKVNDYNELESTYENNLKGLIKNPDLSKAILQQHTDLIKKTEKLQRENESYIKLKSLKENKLNDEKELKLVETQQFAIIANKINEQMKEMNTLIYEGRFNAPLISFNGNTYDFFTPDDTGTGMAYKGLVVFDLSVLKLTKLPILIHDSIILKQISDEAIEKLLELYTSCGKQVIIALDKQNTYTEKSATMLKNSKILELAPNDKTLFGRSWG